MGYLFASELMYYHAENGLSMLWGRDLLDILVWRKIMEKCTWIFCLSYL